MSLNKAQVTTFASSISQAEQDSTTFSQFFDDVIEELGRLDTPVFADQGFEAIVSSTATYSFEATMLRPLYIFLGNELLSPSTEEELGAYSQTWQSDTGTPVAYITDEQNALTYQVYPTPDFNGSIAGADWASNYPSSALALIFVEDRADDIEDYYVLPITFDCLGKEFSYLSDHQDTEYASLCSAMAKLMYSLAGAI